MTKTKLIIMRAPGKVNHKYAEITMPYAATYAKKCNADFLCIYNEHPDFPPKGYQKWALVNLLTQYDRILYIDADLIIRSNTPNLFDIVPYESFGAVNEYPLQDLSKEYPPIDRYDDAKKLRSDIDFKFYINSGVYLFSKPHSFLFSDISDVKMMWGDQSHLSCMLNIHSKIFYELHTSFNYTKMSEWSGFNKDEAYIIHYAGSWGGKPTEEILEMMKKDYK